MGDRANAHLVTSKGTLGIYAHWAGSNLAVAVQEALKSKAAQQRFGDEDYLSRIIVQRVLETLGSESSVDTGFGLYVGRDLPDNSHNVLSVNVSRSTPSIEILAGDDLDDVLAHYTYQEFVSLTKTELKSVI